jgi:hypothetical protein
MLCPHLIRPEQRLDTYQREYRKVQLLYVCLPLEYSKLLQAHVSSVFPAYRGVGAHSSEKY